MRYRLQLIIIFLCLYGELGLVQIFGQDVVRPSVIPPSPNAVSLGIFGDIPVGHYTGIPNIEIPLYEVVSGDISVPIKLQYHASGIKVTQEASWVGLGWALNAGGVITRSVRGWDDFGEYPVLGHTYAGDLPPWDEFNDPHSNTTQADRAKHWKYSINELDPEPDLFYYNFGSYSGKMVFKSKNQVGAPIQAIILNQDPIEIKYDRNKELWTVRTPDGCIYYFSTAEKTNIYTISIDNRDPRIDGAPTWRIPQHEVVNSWYLDSIRSVQNDLVIFKYNTDRSEVMSQYSYSRQVAQVLEMGTEFRPYDMHTKSQTIVDEIILKEIEFKNGVVKFETVDRTDLQYANTIKPQRLSVITVENNSGRTVASYRFSTSYKGDGSDTDKRLFLNAITDLAGRKHTFTYHSRVLPEKTSVAIDHWGYFNGATENATINPYTAVPSYTIKDRFYPGAKRDPNVNSAQAGILTKITYPTGGYTQFEYSLNDYSNFQYTEQKDTMHRALGHYILEPSAPGGFHKEADITEFTLLKREYALLQITISFDHSLYNPNGICLELYIKEANGNWAPFRAYSYSHIITDMNKNQDVHTDKWYLNLDAGTYRMTVLPELGTSVNGELSYQINVPPSGFQPGGGLRIKKVSHFDDENLTTIHYDYTKPSGNKTVSSGKLMSYPKYYFQADASAGTIYYYYNNQVIRLTGMSPEVGAYEILVSESVVPLGNSAQGNIIGYDLVTETRESSSANGTTVYYFNNREEMFNFSHWIPGIPNIVYNDNGLLRRKEYRNAGGQLLREERHTYEMKNDTTIKGLKIFVFPGITGNNWMVKYYDTFSEWWCPFVDTTIVYDHSTPASVKKIITIQQYSYDNPAHKQLTSQVSNNSDGTTSRVMYKYPGDYNTEPYTGMVQKHILNPVIESETRLTNGSTTRVTNAMFHQYKKFDGIYKMELIKKLETVSPINVGTGYAGQMKEVVSFNYNNKGRLIKSTPKDGPTTAYLWGYQNQYPIAEVNMPVDGQVAYTSFEDDCSGSNWMVSAVRYTGDARTGVQSYNLSSGNITKSIFTPNIPYTLSYWSKSSAATVSVAGSQVAAKNTGVTANGWTYFEHVFTPNSSSAALIISGANIIIDELRLHPTDAMMTTLTYTPLVGTTSETDPSGRTVYYEYDTAGRLKLIKNHEGNIVEHYKYRYVNNRQNQ